MQIAPTAIKTEVCQVFDESPTPEIEGFSLHFQLRIFGRPQATAN